MYKYYSVSILLGACGFLFGYIGSLVAKLPVRDRRAVSLETGIQNGPLAISIVLLTFDESAGPVYAFPMFYSLFIVIESVLLALTFNLFPVEEPPSKEVMANQCLTEWNAAGEPVMRARLTEETNRREPLEEKLFLRQTVWTVFCRTEERSKVGQRCLGHRPLKVSKGAKAAKRGSYTWLSFSQVRQRAENAGLGVLAEMAFEQDAKIGIFSPNRPEWLIADLACCG